MNSDLDRWWYWVEPVSDTSRSKIANKHCFMKGHEIVLMVRDQDSRYADISDEDTLSDFVVINLCSPSDTLKKVWQQEERACE